MPCVRSYGERSQTLQDPRTRDLTGPLIGLILVTRFKDQTQRLSYSCSTRSSRPIRALSVVPTAYYILHPESRTYLLRDTITAFSRSFLIMHVQRNHLLERGRARLSHVRTEQRKHDHDEGDRQAGIHDFKV